MDQKVQKQQKNLLIIANTALVSSDNFLKELFKIIQQLPHVKCFSFKKYDMGQTNIIQQADLQSLTEIHLAVVIGQKNDLLQTFSLFINKDSPPILGFGVSEDFNTPLFYNFDTFHTQSTASLIDLIVKQQCWKNLPCDNLMKLSLTIDCRKIAQATAQVQIHRGMNQNVLILNLYILNKCEKEKIKIGTFKGDGLLISTPMGTVCKSLSLNGPIMNRTMENIIVTPICPLSMKFRTLCLPADTHLYIELDEQCRTNRAEIYVDQSNKEMHLEKGQWLRVKKSSYHTRMISSVLQTNEQYFIRTLRNALKWGEVYTPYEMPSFKIKRFSSIE